MTDISYRQISQEKGPAGLTSQSVAAIIEEMVVDYGAYQEKAQSRIDVLLNNMERFDADAALRWRSIMALWKSLDDSITFNYDVLPDGLCDTDELCLVVLGFQLAPDGTMRDELIERLQVAKRSAEKYPNALIVCTGGGTATEEPSATEAGEMAKWLIQNGIGPERVIVEDESITTAQNAIYTLDILEEQYPQVSDIAIISSDYHITTGQLLFEAEAILRAETSPAQHKPPRVVSNAAWKAPSGSLSSMFQAGALIELSGDIETAFDIYYDTYDIHELPSLQ